MGERTEDVSGLERRGRKTLGRSGWIITGLVLLGLGTLTLSPWWVGAEPHGTVYWADPAAGEIGGVRVPGGEREVMRKGIGAASDPTLDADRGVVYWLNSDAGTLQKMNLGGEKKIETVARHLNEPHHLVLDPTKRNLYWVERESPPHPLSDFLSSEKRGEEIRRFP